MKSLCIKLLKSPLIFVICLVLQGCGGVKSTNENANGVAATAMVGSLEEDEIQSVSEQRFEPRRPEGMRDDYNALPNFDATQIHVVCKGDTLTSIARRYQVSVAQLMQENHLTDKNRIYVGQQLVIPGGATASSAVSGSDYCVQKGDTLTSIARRYQVSVAQLMQENHLTDKNRIYVGQRLKVNGASSVVAPSAGNGTYCVQKGDTLTSIAKRFGMSVSSLKDLNHLTSDMIRIGQVLTVSGNGSVASAPVTSVAPKNTSPIQGSSYTVQSGDSLWSIAHRKGITVQELCRINNLSDSSVLQVGQELKLEGNAPRDIVNGSDSVSDMSMDTPSTSGESSINDSFSDLLDSTQGVPTVQVDK
ncbi:MAG TPA: hypothetical protein DEW74_01105 [Opitutae bacterium]|nr:hypothetical protein [Opitutae bacterium]